MFLCKCDCGNTKAVPFGQLQNGGTRSCGCLKLSKIKGHEGAYSSWERMKQHCYGKYNNRYAIYGAKGIRVCDRWLHSFQNFLEDMGDRPEGCTLDRIDPKGAYCPENCRWASVFEQANNRNYNVRVYYNGGYYTLSQFARLINKDYDFVRYRLRIGLKPEEIAFLEGGEVKPNSLCQKGEKNEKRRD